MSGIQYLIAYKVPHRTHGQYEMVVNLTNYGEFEGRVGLKHIRDDILETHSTIRLGFRDRGFGIELYSRAFELANGEGYRVRSSNIDEMSNEAERLWLSKRLNEKFDIRKRWNYYWVVGVNK